MKKLLLVLIIHSTMGIGTMIIAQIPKYSFSLYFEDAIGRIDSVRFIFDKSVQDISDRLRFGWRDITRNPFNNNFEIRCADLGGQDLQSKIFPDYYGNNFCDTGLPQMNSINIRAVDFPIRMYWDSTYFTKDDCLDWSRFTRYFNFALHPWNDPSIYFKMSERSDFIITKKWLLGTEDFRNIYQHDVEGGGKDSIFVIFIGIASEFSGTISTEDEPFEAYKVYPNPVNDMITISSDEAINSTEYEIRDINGNPVKSGYLDQFDFNINVSNLDSGIYFITIMDNELWRVLRFVKQ